MIERIKYVTDDSMRDMYIVWNRETYDSTWETIDLVGAHARLMEWLFKYPLRVTCNSDTMYELKEMVHKTHKFKFIGTLEEWDEYERLERLEGLMNKEKGL